MLQEKPLKTWLSFLFPATFWGASSQSDVDESPACYIYERDDLEPRAHSWLQLCVWTSCRG